MKTLNKWNYVEQKYDLVTLPEGKYAFYCLSEGEIVNCPHCGKKFRYGDGYTSLVFHTNLLGLGYAVCGECHQKELEERKKYEDSKALEKYDVDLNAISVEE